VLESLAEAGAACPRSPREHWPVLVALRDH
jgi:hypothetical protein